MPYSTTCSCGREFAVEATEAGTELECPSCRRSVRVPRLSQLRVAAGESAIPLNAAERVTVAVRDGKLPNNLVCPVTGGLANALVVFHIHCERTWKKGQDATAGQLALGFLLFGWLGALVAAWRGSGEKEVLGRETIVAAPLRVSNDVLQSLSRQRNQRELRRLLSTVPEYAAVFQEYPGSTVTFGSAVDMKKN